MIGRIRSCRRYTLRGIPFNILILPIIIIIRWLNLKRRQKRDVKCVNWEMYGMEKKHNLHVDCCDALFYEQLHYYDIGLDTVYALLEA